MRKKLKNIIVGIVLLIGLALIISWIVNRLYEYEFKDILFVGGILSLGIGILSIFSGDSMGLSLQGLGNINAQYISNANIKGIELERKSKKEGIKNNIKIYFGTINIFISGVIMILISILI